MVSYKVLFGLLVVTSSALICAGRDCPASEGHETKMSTSKHVSGVTSCDSPDREANDPRDRCEEYSREISTSVLSVNNIVCPGSQKTFENFQISNLRNHKDPFTGVRDCSADYTFDCCFRLCFNNNQKIEQIA